MVRHGSRFRNRTIVVFIHSFIHFGFSWLYNFFIVNPRHSKSFKHDRLMNYVLGDKLDGSGTSTTLSGIFYNYEVVIFVRPINLADVFILRSGVKC